MAFCRVALRTNYNLLCLQVAWKHTLALFPHSFLSGFASTPGVSLFYYSKIEFFHFTEKKEGTQLKFKCSHMTSHGTHTTIIRIKKQKKKSSRTKTEQQQNDF